MPRRYVENLVLDGLARIALGLRGAPKDSHVRTVFLALVAANLLFFAWSRYFSSGRNAPADGVLLRRSEPRKAEDRSAPRARRGAAAASSGAASAWPTRRAPKKRSSLWRSDRGSASGALEETTAGWWVFIPSQGSRSSAFRQAAELKALGVNDYFVMGEETDIPWALSLGVFRSEQRRRSPGSPRCASSACAARSSASAIPSCRRCGCR